MVKKATAVFFTRGAGGQTAVVYLYASRVNGLSPKGVMTSAVSAAIPDILHLWVEPADETEGLERLVEELKKLPAFQGQELLVTGI
ncbi:MAG: hypothetical protein JNK05_13445 [Myxococcales bacterium]|nr:hypothetical protein [Myxococcales bacterium]